MPLTLDATDYQSVRRAIDATLTAITLPDATIEDQIFKERAIAWVATRTIDTTGHAEKAAIFKLAALLVMSVPGLLSIVHQANANSDSKATIDPTVKAADLLAQAEEELALTSDSGQLDTSADTTLNMPTVFMVASGARGF